MGQPMTQNRSSALIDWRAWLDDNIEENSAEAVEVSRRLRVMEEALRSLVMQGYGEWNFRSHDDIAMGLSRGQQRKVRVAMETLDE